TESRLRVPCTAIAPSARRYPASTNNAQRSTWHRPLPFRLSRHIHDAAQLRPYSPPPTPCRHPFPVPGRSPRGLVASFTHRFHQGQDSHEKGILFRPYSDIRFPTKYSVESHHVRTERERITDRAPSRGNKGIVRRTVSAHRCDRVSVDRHTVTVQIGISFPRGHPHLGRDLGGQRPGERETETFRVLEDRGRVVEDHHLVVGGDRRVLQYHHQVPARIDPPPLSHGHIRHPPLTTTVRIHQLGDVGECLISGVARQLRARGLARGNRFVGIHARPLDPGRGRLGHPRTREIQARPAHRTALGHLPDS